jgi:hypothetical protein
VGEAESNSVTDGDADGIAKAVVVGWSVVRISSGKEARAATGLDKKE